MKKFFAIMMVVGLICTMSFAVTGCKDPAKPVADKKTEADKKAPEADKKAPEADKKAPEADKKAPEADKKAPEADKKAKT